MPERPPPVGTWTWCPFADEVTWCIAAAGDGAGAGAGCHSCFCCCCAHIVRFCSLFVCWLQLLFSRPMAKSGLIFTSVCPTFVAPTGLWPLLPFPFPIHSLAAPAADSSLFLLPMCCVDSSLCSYLFSFMHRKLHSGREQFHEAAAAAASS